MTAAPRQLKLALFMNTTEYAWLMKKARSESEFDFAFYRDLAQMAERAKFDAVFLAISLPSTTAIGASKPPAIWAMRWSTNR